MARLEPMEAVAGLPVKIGAARLEAVTLGRVFSVMLFKGQASSVRETLGGWPEPGTWISSGEGRLVWSGMGQVLGMGEMVEVPGAAVTDQSDAWAAFRLSGAAAEEVLGRLSPVDFRARSFGEGSVARTLIEHMNALVMRDSGGFEILVFRSMADSALHAIRRAMGLVAAASG